MLWKGPKRPILQEEILHDVCVVLTAAVREVAGCEHDDGIQTLTIITWKRTEMLDTGSLLYWFHYNGGFVFVTYVFITFKVASQLLFLMFAVIHEFCVFVIKIVMCVFMVSTEELNALRFQLRTFFRMELSHSLRIEVFFNLAVTNKFQSIHVYQLAMWW